MALIFDVAFLLLLGIFWKALCLCSWHSANCLQNLFPAFSFFTLLHSVYPQSIPHLSIFSKHLKHVLPLSLSCDACFTPDLYLNTREKKNLLAAQFLDHWVIQGDSEFFASLKCLLVYETPFTCLTLFTFNKNCTYSIHSIN